MNSNRHIAKTLRRPASIVVREVVKPDLASFTVAKLREYAAETRVKVTTRMTKPELIAALS